MKKFARVGVTLGASLLLLTGCTSTDAGSTDSETTGNVDLSSYQAAAETALKPIEAYEGPTEGPIAKDGVKVMVLVCGFAADGCKGPADAAPEAAEALGWDVTVVDGQFDPQIYTRTIAQAIDQKYDAIILSSITDSAVSQSLKEAREAGIVIGSFDGANEASETGVTFEVDEPLAEQGENMANYLIWKSEGNLKAQVLQNPEFKVVMSWTDAAIDTIEACATCSVVRTDQFTANDAAGRLPTLVTQSLRQNPEINAVIGGYDAAMLSTVPSLESAGLSEQAKIAGFNGIPAFIDFIRDGRATVTSAVPMKWGMWAAFDNVNRVLSGEEPVEHNLPTRLIAAENIDEIPTGSQWEGDVDYKAEFTRIWNGS